MLKLNLNYLLLIRYLTAASAALLRLGARSSRTGWAALALGAAALSAAPSTNKFSGGVLIHGDAIGNVGHYIIEKDFIYKNCVP